MDFTIYREAEKHEFSVTCFVDHVVAYNTLYLTLRQFFNPYALNVCICCSRLLEIFTYIQTFLVHKCACSLGLVGRLQILHLSANHGNETTVAFLSDAGFRKQNFVL